MEKTNINISDYRYERKFVNTDLSKYEVENIVKLHPAIFSEIYKQRFVNNIYFDSYNKNNYFDNIDGANNRMKVRVRWYGDLLGLIEEPTLEIKIKNGLLGKKISFPIKPFNLTFNTDIYDILKPFKFYNENIMIDLNPLTASLLNRYSRRYYQSSDNNYRITIDNEQSFYSINKENNFFLHSYTDYDTVILELKYKKDFDEFARHLTSKFSFRMTKSSKYVSGIQKIKQVYSFN